MKETITYLFYSIILIQVTFGQQRKPVSFEIPTEYKDNFEKDAIEFQEYLKPLGEATGKAYTLWSNVSRGMLKDYNLDSLYSIYESLKDKLNLKVIEFIENNPHSYASMYYFDQKLLNTFRLKPDSLLSIYSVLNKNLQATPLGKFINDALKRKTSLLLESEMPVFLFKTDKGQQFDLSQFRSEKYVLICFWASWCGPCIKNIPSLKKIEQSYREKGLQIISISIDQDPNMWLRAVEKYAMPWLQTCDLPEYISESTVRTLYEVQYIPQYFLIDKNGNLIYENFQLKDDDNYTILNEILGVNLN